MMNFTTEKLLTELDNLLSFWLRYMINADNSIVKELSNNNIPNNDADLGSMYLSRIIYGASAACKALNTDKYLILADIAFEKLISDFKNPKGGFFWAMNSSNQMIHDSENVNMSQAFILYGLVEYASIKPEKKVRSEINLQVHFFENNLKDTHNGGYLDGFSSNWKPETIQTKSLATHLHLLEAYIKLYELNNNKSFIALIENLLTIILEKFIDKKTSYCLHRLTPEWDILPNFVWAGHNAECSWILCKAARTIKNQHLILECNAMAISSLKQVIDEAYDTMNGGLYNIIENGGPTENVKIWWPQAEAVIALLYCSKITNDEYYKNLAAEISHFISTKFIDNNGEWYTEISKSGIAIPNIPKIQFWKSLYHNVRYYIEVMEML